MDETLRFASTVLPYHANTNAESLDQLSVASFENGLWRVRAEGSYPLWPATLNVHLPDGTLVANVSIPSVDSSARWYEGAFFKAPEGAESLLFSRGNSFLQISAGLAGAPSVVSTEGPVPSAGSIDMTGPATAELPLEAPAGFLAIELPPVRGLSAIPSSTDGEPLRDFIEIAPNLWIWYGADADAPALVRLHIRMDPGTTPGEQIDVKLTDQRSRLVHTRISLPAPNSLWTWTRSKR